MAASIGVAYVTTVVTTGDNYILTALIMLAALIAIEAVIGFKSVRATRGRRPAQVFVGAIVVALAYVLFASCLLLFLRIEGSLDKGGLETMSTLAPLGRGAGLVGGLCGLANASPRLSTSPTDDRSGSPGRG
jgi:hypothetical protein